MTLTLVVFVFILAAASIGLFVWGWNERKRSARQMSVLSERIANVTEKVENYASGLPMGDPAQIDDQLSALEKALHDLAAGIRESAAKESAPVDFGLDVVCSIDKNGVFTFASPASHELFGYQPEQLVGKELADMVVAEDGKSTRDAINQFIGGNSISSFENRIRSKSGALVDIKWSARWSEQEKCLFWIARDITAKKQAERLKREFVSMISHDLRTPLMSVQASLTLLSNGVCGELTEKARFNVIDAERNISYVINLINGLLDIEKMESGRLQLTLLPVELSSIIERSCELVRPLAAEKKIELKVSNTDVELVADESRMIQVAVNLLSNALKFSPSGTEIDVKVEHGEHTVEVRVIDNGPGIDDEEQKVIFERFAQGRSADDQVGSGLGLAICKAIVEEHGGEIGVVSKIGEGSTFWFRLPLNVVEMAPAV